MKKTIITSVCLLGLASAAFAQGNVNWGSFSGGFLQVRTNSTQSSSFFEGGGGVTGGGATGALTTTALSFYGALLYNNSSAVAVALPTSFAQINSTWTDTGLIAQNATGSAGLMTGLPVNTSATVPWASGTTKAVMYVAWSANLGSTWATAFANMQNATYLAGLSSDAFFGLTGQGTVNSGVVTPNAANPGASVFSNTGIKNLSMQLYVVPVPEPSTLALAGLGGLALLALRRRK